MKPETAREIIETTIRNREMRYTYPPDAVDLILRDIGAQSNLQAWLDAAEAALAAVQTRKK